MMQDQGYKTRALEVRRSARAQMLDIRRARLANRKPSKVAVLGDAEQPSAPLVSASVEDGWPDAEDPFASAIEPVDEVGDADLQGGDAPQNVVLAEDDWPDPLGSESATMPLAEEYEATPVGDTETEVAAVSDPVQEAPVCHDHEVAEQVEVPEAFDDQADAPVEDVSDLCRLPGAGPGLIWMLRECGVETLADLAAQDAGELSNRLGIVGQILDTRSWISFARQATEPTVSGQ